MELDISSERLPGNQNPGPDNGSGLDALTGVAWEPEDATIEHGDLVIPSSSPMANLALYSPSTFSLFPIDPLTTSFPPMADMIPGSATLFSPLLIDPFVVSSSPTADLILNSASIFSPLPFDHDNPSVLAQEALCRLSSEIVFSIGGSKTPKWSTHAVMLKHSLSNR